MRRGREVQAVLFGCILSLALLGALEGLFRVEAVRVRIPGSARTPSLERGVEYDLSAIELGYLRDLQPRPEPNVLEPVDYRAYKFEDCRGERMQLVPYWNAVPGCRSRVILRSAKSGRVLTDTHYTFDQWGLRVVPSAHPRSEKFLVFLGCSFTYGEGLEDEETFANQIVKKLPGRPNAFNLATGGWGPGHVLQMLSNPEDPRLKGLKGSFGIAIYTFINDHFERLLGSMSLLRRMGVPSNFPYFYLRGAQVVFGGSLSDRTILTPLLGLLSKSEMLSHFGVNYPSIGKYELRLFAKVMGEIKRILRERKHVDRLFVSIWPGEGYPTGFVGALEKEGVEVLDFSSVPLNKVLKGREGIPGNGHPSALANRFYADLVAYELGRRGVNLR